MQRIVQAAAGLFPRTIVVLSPSPPSVRPTTGAAHGLGDRAGIWIRLFTPSRASDNYAAELRGPRSRLLKIGFLDRHARMCNFLADAAASCLGVGLSYALLKLRAAVIRK
jgi:hypothetical protein